MGMKEPNRCRAVAKVDGCYIGRCSNDAKWTEIATWSNGDIFPAWGFCEDCKLTRASKHSDLTWMLGRHPEAKDDLRIQA